MDEQELRANRELQRAEALLARQESLRKYGFQTSPENDRVARDASDMVPRSDFATLHAGEVTVAMLKQLFAQNPVYTWEGDGSGGTGKNSRVFITSNRHPVQQNAPAGVPTLRVSTNAAANTPIGINNLAAFNIRTNTKVYTGLKPVSISIQITAPTESTSLQIAEFIEATLLVNWEEWCRGRWHSIQNVAVVSDSRNRNAGGSPNGVRDHAHLTIVNFVVMHQWMSTVSPLPGSYKTATILGVVDGTDVPGVDGRVDPAITDPEDIRTLYAIPEYPE